MARVRGDRNGDVSGRVLAFYLHEMRDRGLSRSWGCSSTVELARERLSDVKAGRARDLIAVGGPAQDGRALGTR